MTALAERDNRICAITAAMKYGTGLQYFSAAHKDRFFDVGIAEEFGVTFAAGLSSNGMLQSLRFIPRFYSVLMTKFCMMPRLNVGILFWQLIAPVLWETMEKRIREFMMLLF